MTAKEIAKVLAREPQKFGGRGKSVFVVLPYADYQKLCEAVEDALDLMDLEQARRENAGKPGVPWEAVKRRLGLDRKSTKERKESAVRSRNRKTA